jgi:hypothetical protein
MDMNLIVLVVLIAPIALIGAVLASLLAERDNLFALYNALRRLIGGQKRHPYERLIR